jgi:hypothetical protein
VPLLTFTESRRLLPDMPVHANVPYMDAPGGARMVEAMGNRDRTVRLYAALDMSTGALALMVMRALGLHPRSGLALNLGRYRVPRVAVDPVLPHVSFLAASGEVGIFFCRSHCSLSNM